MKLFDLPEAEWQAWLEGRPAIIQELAARFPPNLLYENTEVPGQRWTVVSYSEDGTLKMSVDSRFNDFLLMEREVFGVTPDCIQEVEE